MTSLLSTPSCWLKSRTCVKYHSIPRLSVAMTWYDIWLTVVVIVNRNSWMLYVFSHAKHSNKQEIIWDSCQTVVLAVFIWQSKNGELLHTFHRFHNTELIMPCLGLTAKHTFNVKKMFYDQRPNHTINNMFGIPKKHTWGPINFFFFCFFQLWLQKVNFWRRLKLLGL